jgi:hypothetical protein
MFRRRNTEKMEVNKITEAVIGAAIEVHHALVSCFSPRSLRLCDEF